MAQFKAWDKRRAAPKFDHMLMTDELNCCCADEGEFYIVEACTLLGSYIHAVPASR